MRIAFVLTRGDSIGGAQIHVRDLSQRLIEEGHQVRVFLGQGGALTQALEASGISYGILRHLTHPLHPGKDALALLELTRALRRFQPDLVSSHSSKAGLLARLAGRYLGIPTLFTAHGWSFTEGISDRKRRLYRLIERMAAPLASKLICVSDYDRSLAARSRVGEAHQLITIHNGMPHRLEDRVADPGIQPARLVMVARLDGQKDHPSLFQALRTIPGVELDLVGDGPLRSELENLAEALELSDRVHFLGQRSDVAAILARAQIFVLASHYEGFPRSILEAMRTGLPVVASDVAGVKEAVLDGETGFLIPKGDVETLREKLLGLTRDPNLRKRMGVNGRRRFLENFTFEHMYRKTLAVYREVLPDGKNQLAARDLASVDAPPDTLYYP